MATATVTALAVVGFSPVTANVAPARSTVQVAVDTTWQLVQNYFTGVDATVEVIWDMAVSRRRLRWI